MAAPKLKDIEALCATKGMRLTEQRRVIARVLAAAGDHPDVEELYRRCSAIDDRISISICVGSPGSARAPRFWRSTRTTCRPENSISARAFARSAAATATIRLRRERARPRSCSGGTCDIARFQAEWPPGIAREDGRKRPNARPESALT